MLFVFFEASVYANGQNIIENHQSSTDHEFIELGQRGYTNVWLGQTNIYNKVFTVKKKFKNK